MIKTIICDRCLRQIEPEQTERVGLMDGPAASIVHIPGYDGGFSETFSYIDFCPSCRKAFEKWMEGGKDIAAE